MVDKGHCPHGEFDLMVGCPQCIADRAGGILSQEENKKEAEPIPESTALVQVYPHGEKDVVDLLNEAQTIADKAEVFTVTTEADVELATNDLSIIAGVKKKIEAKKKEYLEPLETHKKNIIAAFAFLLDPISSADKALRVKTNDFLTEQRRKAVEAERIAREEQELARRKAELNGTPALKPEMIPTTHIQQTHRADLGMSGQMDVWKWELIDLDLVPKNYMKLDEAVITKAVKASSGKMVIAGIRIFNEPTLRVEARKS
ncbi:hypothetical protein LCGC14_3063240 [marine sediment metagenome]|uniref:Uncharacterized protein n=1 Tax=marine sediment metagenome TaxID=412755 RepID=A0A0F8WI67_9ZZZZ